jgi:hypothetical protein
LTHKKARHSRRAKLLNIAISTALRDDAEYASLARHAVTDNGRALIAAVCQQVEDWEAQEGTRKRKRDSKAPAFARAIEGFVGDLLIAIAHKERPEGWVRRSVGRDAFTDARIGRPLLRAEFLLLQKLLEFSDFPVTLPDFMIRNICYIFSMSICNMDNQLPRV